MRSDARRAGLVGIAAFVAIAALSVERALVAQDRLAPAAESGAAWITEVDVDGETGDVHLLLSVGRDGGVERGDVIDVERDGKKIAQATVVTSYSDMSVATIEKGPQARVARGDWIKVRARAGKTPRPADEGPIKVTAVGEGSCTIGAGTARGLRKGQEATLLRNGKPVGRVRIDAIENDRATLVLVEGEALVGDTVAITPAAHEGHGKADPDLTRDELRKLERAAEKNPRLDFVGTNFLGVVAEIEHPTPVVAGCHVGVLVRRVIQGSPAELARIRAGDRVIAIDDRVVRTPAEIHKGIKRRTADLVKVTIIREDVLHSVTADFSKR